MRGSFQNILCALQGFECVLRLCGRVLIRHFHHFRGNCVLVTVAPTPLSPPAPGRHSSASCSCGFAVLDASHTWNRAVAVASGFSHRAPRAQGLCAPPRRRLPPRHGRVARPEWTGRGVPLCSSAEGRCGGCFLATVSSAAVILRYTFAFLLGVCQWWSHGPDASSVCPPEELPHCFPKQPHHRIVSVFTVRAGVASSVALGGRECRSPDRIIPVGWEEGAPLVGTQALQGRGVHPAPWRAGSARG